MSLLRTAGRFTLPIGRALFLAFAGLVLVVAALAWVIADWQARQLVSEHSRLLTRTAELSTEDLLRGVVEPVRRALLADLERVRRGQVRRYEPRALTELLLPDFEQLDRSGSMMVADESGYQFLILRYDRAALASPLLDSVRDRLPPPDPERPQVFTRDVRLAQWGASSSWTLLAPDGRTPVQQWQLDLDGYDPRRRPWFEAALEGFRPRSGAERADDDSGIRWTEPYALFTTKSPGISASAAERDPEGALVIVAYDVLLDDISAFTRAHRPSPNGVVFVFDDAGRLIGLPADPRFEDAGEREKALLRPLTALDLPLASTAVAAWRAGALNGPEPQRLEEEPIGTFWSSVLRVRLDGTRSFWIGVAVPESDLLVTARRTGRFVALVTAAALAGAALLAALLSRRFSRPLRELAATSRRIAALDLAPQAQRTTRLREVNQLAASVETMRGALASDLARRTAAAESLRVSEQRFRRLVENAIDPIVLFDLTGRIVDFNRAACVESGRSPEELASSTVGDLSPGWPGPSPSTLASSLRPEETVTVRANLRRKNGEEFPAEVRVARIDADPGHPLLLAMARDVSLRERLELESRHTQKMAAIGRLAGGIAHDFNNLLTVIMGYGDSLRDALLPGDPRRDDVEVILSTSSRAAAMTKQLLALSRRQITAPRVVDLREEIPAIAKSLLRLLGEDIALDLRIDSATSPIEIDPSELQQLLVNLAVNARDAMPKGGNLTLETRDVAGASSPEAPPWRCVELVVHDTGGGMEPALLDRIFEPFFTTKEAGKGTGLGLATCAAIVDRAGGQIRATSEPGTGSVFIVRLPAADATGDRGAPPTPPDPTSPSRVVGTILLVEDEAGVQAVAERVLRSRGFDLTVAADGVDALSRYEELGRPVDLLLTDVVMPRMGGAELALRLRERQPDIGILFVSGYADHETVQDLVRRGAAFLSKPFSPSALVRAVSDALARRTPPGIWAEPSSEG